MGDTPADAAASTEDGNKQTSGDTSAAGDEPKTVTLTTKQLAERLERAKPADYDDLKAKAQRLDEIEAANKSEIELATEARTAAEQAAAQAQAEALRWKIAAKHQITDEDAELFLTGTDEETLTKQAERLSQRTSDRKKTGNHVPREGTTPSDPPKDDLREFTRQLFQGGQTT